MAPKVIILMADYGHDPTEVAIPWRAFKDAGFDITFATENGSTPACDEKMYKGVTGTLLGAAKPAKEAYHALTTKDPSFDSPESWTAPAFSLNEFDLVFLPGGHEKRVRQIIDSARVHSLLAEYFPKTKKSGSSGGKCLAAICHGVQVLAAATYHDGKSVLHDVETTALIGLMEQGIFQATRLFLGDYYKTYGAGTPSVQQIVTDKLDKPEQFKSSLSSSPFVVEDPTYNYLSARFPPDAAELAKRTIEMVKKAVGSQA